MTEHRTKYANGDEVEALGIPGVITAIYVRSGNVTYEFSYPHEGQPKSCVCAEVELQMRSKSKIGFNKEH